MSTTTRPAAPTRHRAAAAVLCAALTLTGCTAQPEETAAPDRATLTAAVEKFVDDSHSPGMRNLRAVLVSVDGEPMVELYVGEAATGGANIWSITKSVVATLVGTAVRDGLLSLDQTVGELLPSYADAMHPDLADVTLEQLLTMTAGLPGDYRLDDVLSGADDWVGTIVRQGPDRPPGGGFVYSSVTSHLLAAILVEATGRPLLDYAREQLFDPLGIDSRPAVQPREETRAAIRRYDRAGFAWPRDPQGVHVGYALLKLTPADLLALGNLYLAEGQWQGEQVVPAEWVRAATRPAVQTRQSVGHHYGYQWWVTEAGDHAAYAAVGYGGQIVEVVPDLGLVVVAVMDVDDIGAFDATTWELMTDQVLVPALEGADG